MGILTLTCVVWASNPCQFDLCVCWSSGPDDTMYDAVFDCFVPLRKGYSVVICEYNNAPRTVPHYYTLNADWRYLCIMQQLP